MSDSKERVTGSRQSPELADDEPEQEEYTRGSDVLNIERLSNNPQEFDDDFRSVALHPGDNTEESKTLIHENISDDQIVEEVNSLFEDRERSLNVSENLREEDPKHKFDGSNREDENVILPNLGTPFDQSEMVFLAPSQHVRMGGGTGKESAGLSDGKGIAKALNKPERTSQGGQDIDYFGDIPDSIFPYLSVIPDDLLPGILHKRREEILCEELDSEQRKLLRDERIARVYYNPVSTILAHQRSAQKRETDRIKQTMRKSIEDTVQMQQTMRKSIEDTVQMQQTSLKERLKKTCKIYGVKCKLETDTPRHRRASILCGKIQKLPPYHGPHAYHVTPYEMLDGKADRMDYQFVSKNIPQVNRISTEDFKEMKVNRHPTTTHAIWRRQRFASPEGCDYRQLKEQFTLAKYKAMLKTLNSFTQEDQIAVRNSQLWEHAVPIDSLLQADDQGESLPTDVSLTSAPSTEVYLLAEERAKRKSTQPLHTNFTGKTEIERDPLRDLLLHTEITRQRLSSFLTYRPKGDFLPDPRNDPEFLKLCGNTKPRRSKT
ncbi:hypothetical protein BgiMline_028487 [Biomphalaria glabrata]|nr:hypothetical protein BgiMline_014283 [Biomphalaria glabrata]